jgi:thioredoxin 2
MMMQEPAASREGRSRPRRMRLRSNPTGPAVSPGLVGLAPVLLASAVASSRHLPAADPLANRRTLYSGAMAIIVCPSCAARNRVRPIASGFPRCPKCKSELPWLVDADAETFAAETSASVPVVVDFWAAWCGPCRMISPVLEDLAGRHAGRLKVVKVDVDANPGLAARFGAQSIPLLVVIRDGHEVDRIVGALPRAALEQRLEPVLAS